MRDLPKRLLSSTLYAVLLLTAPGIPCYQALAGGMEFAPKNAGKPGLSSPIVPLNEKADSLLNPQPAPGDLAAPGLTPTYPTQNPAPIVDQAAALEPLPVARTQAPLSSPDSDPGKARNPKQSPHASTLGALSETARQDEGAVTVPLINRLHTTVGKLEDTRRPGDIARTVNTLFGERNAGDSVGVNCPGGGCSGNSNDGSAGGADENPGGKITPLLMQQFRERPGEPIAATINLYILAAPEDMKPLERAKYFASQAQPVLDYLTLQEIRFKYPPPGGLVHVFITLQQAQGISSLPLPQVKSLLAKLLEVKEKKK